MKVVKKAALGLPSLYLSINTNIFITNVKTQPLNFYLVEACSCSVEDSSVDGCSVAGCAESDFWSAV